MNVREPEAEHVEAGQAGTEHVEAERPPVRCFESTWHPNGAPAALVYARAGAAPLAFCTLPVLLLTTAAALMGHVVVPGAPTGLAAALAVATWWTRLRLHRTWAQICVCGAQAALRSVADCLSGEPLRWAPVLDVRAARAALGVTVGYEGADLERAAWPEHEALQEALAEARARTRRRPVPYYAPAAPAPS